MRTPRRRAMAAAAIVAVLSPWQGSWSKDRQMASARSTATTIEWEGAAGRRPERFLVLRVKKNEAEGGGFLGLRRAPSLPGYMPEGRRLTGEVLAGGSSGAQVVVRAPGARVETIPVGAVVAVGMVDANHCICILRAPDGLTADAVPQWAAGQPCP